MQIVLPRVGAFSRITDDTLATKEIGISECQRDAQGTQCTVIANLPAAVIGAGDRCGVEVMRDRDIFRGKKRECLHLRDVIVDTFEGIE
ncbi:hypothetical protein D1872_295940 [compost metagenome]